MGWPASFLAELSGTRLAPIWELRSVSTALAPQPVMAWSSRDRLSPEVLRVSGDGVEPITWAPTWGGFTVAAAGADLSDFTLLRRGFLYQLYMGFPGMATADYQPIALGAFRNFSRSQGGAWILDFAGLGYALASRLETGSLDHAPLFYSDVTATTIDTTAYTAGDTSIRVASTTSFDRETGGSYLLKIAGSGGDFYVTATGTAVGPVRFTGLSATGQLGTTASNASVGAAVTEVHYIADDHPLDAARKVLASTGAGSNGVWDTLPAPWGLGLPDGLIDHADIAWTRAEMAVSSGSYTIEMIQEAEGGESNPLSWLLSYLTPLGVWPTVRHGRLTFRCATHPWASSRTPYPIDDRMIVALEQQGYNDSAPREFAYTGVSTPDNPAGTLYADTPPSTRPAGTFWAYTTLGTWSNTSAIKTEVAGRLRYWPTRPHEVYTVTLGGLSAAQLCAGDIVALTTSRTFRRPRLTGGSNAIAGYRGLVTAVQPDFRAASVRLTLAMLPDTPD